jgi:hypothetical protein
MYNFIRGIVVPRLDIKLVWEIANSYGYTNADVPTGRHGAGVCQGLVLSDNSRAAGKSPP